MVALFTFSEAQAQSGYEKDNEIFKVGIEALKILIEQDKKRG